MTSYIMKNVVLWVSEIKGVQLFKIESLMDKLLDCIIYLRLCVIKNNLPSYMIPERNLLAGRIDFRQSQQLNILLSDLLHEGPRMFLRCDKLREAMVVMYMTTEMFREFGEKRNKVESLKLMLQIIRNKTCTQNMYVDEREQRVLQNEQCHDTCISLLIAQLIHVDVQPLRQAGLSADEINDMFKTRLRQLLS